MASNNDISNKTVVVVLVLVMLVSVLSLAISMNAVKRVGSLAHTAQEAAQRALEASKVKPDGAGDRLVPPPVVTGNAKVTITVVPNPADKQ